MICRDIWTLYLCLLPSPPPPEPLLYEQDIEGNVSKEDSTTRRAHPTETKAAGDHQDEETKKKPSDESDPESDARSNKASSSDSGSDSDTESNKDDDDDEERHRKNIMDEEMASLLRGLSDSEPDTDDDELEDPPNAGQGDNTTEHDDSEHKKRRGHRGGRHESPTCTLAVLLVACWTIRVPVTIMDLIRWGFLTLPPFLPGYFCGIRSVSLTFRLHAPLYIRLADQSTT